MNNFAYFKRVLIVTVASLGLALSCLNAAAQPFTLTYDGLGVSNLDPIPAPYPGISTATVTHWGSDQNGNPFQNVFFYSGVAPGDRFGDLATVAVAPYQLPSDFGLVDPAWGVISITPTFPGTFVRLISFDIASYDDNDVDEIIPGIFVHAGPPYIDVLWSGANIPVAGDVNNTHTLINFGGTPVDGAVDQPLTLWWESRRGQVGVDNVQFEIIGDIPQVIAQTDFYSMAQGGTLAVGAPGVLGNDALAGDTGPLTAAPLVGPTKGTLNLANDGGFAFTSTGAAGMDFFTYRATDAEANTSDGTALVSILPPGASFYDDFARPAGFTELTPWMVWDGTWSIGGGILTGRTNGTVGVPDGHADIYVDENWTDYAVEVRARVAANGYGWAVGGRLNPVTGEMYEVFLYANYLPGAPWRLHLTKHVGWRGGGAITPDVEVPVTPGSTDLHSVKMSFIGNRILVEFDGVQYMDFTDNSAPYVSGGIKVGMYSENSAGLSVEDVIVTQLARTPSHDTSASAVDLDGDNRASLVLAQGALTDGYIVVGVSMYDPVAGASITAATYDGMPMGLKGTVQSASAYTEVYLFGLAVGNKPAGNYNVVVTGSTGIDQLVFGASSFSGVNQQAPTFQTGPFASATGSSSTASVDVNSAFGDLVVDILSHDNGASSLGADQLESWKQENAADRIDGVSSRETATGVATTMSHAKTVSAPWSLGAMALKGAGPPPPDTTPPTITSVTAVNATAVQVVFSEPVATASAQTLANYNINNGVTISAAVLGGDTRTVTLTTTALASGYYILTVNNVTDRATAPNPMAPNSQAVFGFGLSPVFNASASAVDTDGNNNASLTFAQGALTDGYAVVGISMWDPVVEASITTVTYDGAPMTLLGTIQDANAYSEAYLFGLAVGNKAAGNYNVVVTGSAGIDQVVFGVSSFSGVSQTTPTGLFASETGFTTTASVDVRDSAAGDVVVDILSQDDGTSTPGAGQTQNWRQEDATDRTDGVSSRETATGATTTMSYTESVASSWSIGAVALKGAGPPPPDITPPTITSVTVMNATTVRVVFSEPVATASAQTLANYRINNGVTISAAVLGADTLTVTLTTSALVTGNYNLTVNNVTDRATPPNTIVANSQVDFSWWTDTDRPTIISITATNAVTVEVVFSEPVEEVSAETLANYSINNGVTISAAVLEADPFKKVTLTTSTLASGNYILTVNNVTDQNTPANPILPDSQLGFSFTPSPVFNAAASAVDLDGNNSASLVFAQGALTDGYVVVGISMWDPVVGTSITAVTYDGTPMTLLGTIQDANAYSEAYLFGLAVGNKAAGNYTVVVTGSTGIDQVVFGVTAFSGVSQTTPTGPVASATGSSTTASVDVSSTEGDVVVDIISQDDGTSNMGQFQTLNWRQEDATDRADGVSSRETATGAATTTMSYLESAASSWSMVAVALKAGGPPPPDTTRPTITSVSAVNATTVQVVFSEPVEEVSAETLANYGISGGVPISAAVLGGDTRTVTLTTSALVAGNYTLTVNNVTDRATVPNPILPGSQAAFSFALSPVFNAAASAVDVDGNNSASLVIAHAALNGGYIVVGVSMYDPVAGASITAVTYDGTAMTLLGTIQDANAYTEVYLFGLAVGNKVAGNYNVVVTGSTGIDQLVFGVSAFSGVSQTTPTGAFASATGWDTAPSVNVSSAAGDVVVDALSHDTGASSVGAGQTQNWKQEDSTDRTDGVSSRETAIGAATTMSHTKTASAPWSIGAIALKP